MSVLLSESSTAQPTQLQMHFGAVSMCELAWMCLGWVGTMLGAVPLPGTTIPPQRPLWWLEEVGTSRIDPFGRQLLALSSVVPYHTLGVISQQTGSAPSPSLAEPDCTSLPSKNCFCQCYFGLLQDFSLSWGTGIAGVSVLLLNLSAEAEPDLNWGNFDGLEHWMESNECYQVRFKFKVLHHANRNHPPALPHSCSLHSAIQLECQDGLR